MSESHPERPKVGTILQGASHVKINNGTFIAAQDNNFIRGPKDAVEELFERAASNAIFNSGGRADEVRCYPGTREEILKIIDQWANPGSERQHRMLWLSGPAGAGKSAIVQTIAERCKVLGRPAANFFFFRADSSRNHPQAFVVTLLCQLLAYFPMVKTEITTILDENPLILRAAIIQDQIEKLLLLPFSRLDMPPAAPPIVLFIDGLDECMSDHNSMQRHLVHTLHNLATRENSPFVVLIASRAEPHLIMAFKTLPSPTASIFLDESYLPAADIRVFVTAKFEEIRQAHHLSHTITPDWPSRADITSIVEKSSGQFIYAATVTRFIAKSPANPRLSLEKVLGIRPVTTDNSPFAQIDALYMYILSQAEDHATIKDIFAAHFVRESYKKKAGIVEPYVSSPSFLGVERINMEKTLPIYDNRHMDIDIESCVAGLLALVRFSERKLTFHHASLRDFLLDKSRSGVYFVDLSKFASAIAPSLLKDMPSRREFSGTVAVVCLVVSPTMNLAKTLRRPPVPGPHNIDMEDLEKLCLTFYSWIYLPISIC